MAPPHAPLSPIQRFAETIHIVGLGVWIGAILLAATSAAILFPTVKTLEPTLRTFSEYSGEHWRITAGIPAQKIFFAADIVQLVCAAGACAGAIVLVVTRAIDPWNPRATNGMVRSLPMTIVMVLFGIHLFFVSPTMSSNWAQFLAYAKAGEMELALPFHEKFTSTHPISTKILGGLLIALVVTLFAALNDVTRRTTHPSNQTST